MAKKHVKSAAVKAAETEVKRLREKTRVLLAKANKTVREVRKDVSTLKKAGMASKRIDVRHYRPTRYMLSKIKKNADIIAGKAVAIKAPREVREQYTSKGLFEERQGRLIVPKEYEGETARITRGLVTRLVPLKGGQMRQVIIPAKVTDMTGLVQNLDSLEKRDNEMFGFYLGRGRSRTFVDHEELRSEIEVKYAHLFKPKTNHEAFQHFMLVRFRPNGNISLPDAPDDVEPWGGGPRPPKKRAKIKDARNPVYLNQLRKDAARKKRERARETEEDRKDRLEQQRIRQAQYRQRKFEDN